MTTFANRFFKPPARRRTPMITAFGIGLALVVPIGGAEAAHTAFHGHLNAVIPQTGTETVLHVFAGGSDGAGPEGTLLQDGSGALYGTTLEGGSSRCLGGLGCGTVFKLTPPAPGRKIWNESRLHVFRGGTDGSAPFGSLASDGADALYGTTARGGDPACSRGCGTIFKLTPPTRGRARWAETILYAFKGGADGTFPAAGMIFDASGSLYGTTNQGGQINCQAGCGTVFKLSPPPAGQNTWSKTVLYAFKGGIDGANPFSDLIFDMSGQLYGTTVNGGSTACAFGSLGCGTVFKLTPPPPSQVLWTETVLYAFQGASDGYDPEAALVFDASGALYGTTFYGGAGNLGVAFKLTPPPAGQVNWPETVIYTFKSNPGGAYPHGALFADGTGVLYGTATSGAGHQHGAFYKLLPPSGSNPNWTETVLHAFTGVDGDYPIGGLIRDSSGAFYGTTFSGGVQNCSSGCGVVFKLIP